MWPQSQSEHETKQQILKIEGKKLYIYCIDCKKRYSNDAGYGTQESAPRENGSIRAYPRFEDIADG